MKTNEQQGVAGKLANGCVYHHYRQDITPSADFHSHDYFEFYFFIDGNVTYCIEEKTFELMSGDVLVIPPGKLHKPYVSSNLKYERAVLSMNRDFFTSLEKADPSISDEIRKLRDEGRMLISLRGKSKEKTLSLLSEIDREIRLNAQSREAAVWAYVTILLVELIRVAKSQKNSEKSVVSESIVPCVIEYINTNISEPLSSQSVADEFFVSKYYLQHIFKNYTNVSFYDYILSKRIIYAKSLIRHGESLTNACFMCGFKDYSAFYKAFLKKTGISPKKFKNNFETSNPQ